MTSEIEAKHPVYTTYERVHVSNDRLGYTRAAFNWQTQGPGNSRRSKNRDCKGGYPRQSVLSAGKWTDQAYPAKWLLRVLGQTTRHYVHDIHVAYSMHVTGTNLSKYVCTLLLYWQVWIAGEDQRISVGRQLPNWIKRRTWLQCCKRFTLVDTVCMLQWIWPIVLYIFLKYYT